ncbi:low temperature requirement protein A [Saccharopolyspora sp. TS4A08]|uniref:Low temperature requirement protein A n=1 Tax=Saccharopolyspora ipomoeae TaxID=3042027 RepID=A0ABT6PUV2_9PSEU|nr:low temperature requirement protein A [Saccharopolyspora sp. TS4A08]MDI2031784.1 low temperature requirement protein A [Saccharopolyspora sp. TS4A08]
MAERRSRWAHREVSPLELFFDLVFVLAVSQLTHHLIEHLTWHGAAETLLLLVAVCGVWAFTSFEVTMLDVERRATRAVTAGVMGCGLFMNAGIAHAFADGPWLFVIPMLAALAGAAGFAALRAPSPELREHFRRVLVWIAASMPFWLVGAGLDAEWRMRLWGVAALIDLVGTWTAHPVPRRALRSTSVPFDASHMLERMRLFLIILLGETVLTIGRVMSEEHPDVRTLLSSLGVFVALVCLWLTYFGRGEQQVADHIAATDDPIRSVHLGINAVYGVMAGLVVLAAGSELVIAHAEDAHAGIGGVLLLGGPTLYLLAQMFYFRATTGIVWIPRGLGAIALTTGAVAAYWLPPLVAVLVLVLVLLVLVSHIARERGAAAEAA